MLHGRLLNHDLGSRSLVHAFPRPWHPAAAANRLALIARGVSNPGIKQAQEDAANRPPRFYIEQKLPQEAGLVVELGPDESKHATRALRLSDGDRVELCDGAGGVGLAQITAGGRKHVSVETIRQPEQEAWVGPRWQVAAGFSMLKGGRADWLVEKCTELGAHSLTPLVSQRVHGAGAGWKLDSKPSKHKDDSPHGRQARWERVAVAATKQSLRAHGLAIQQQTPLVEFLPEVAAAKLALVAAAGAPELFHAEADIGALRDGDAALLIVGPEGDFTPEEVDELIAAGAQPVGLGPLRLRVETAAIALLAAATTLYRSKR